MPLLSRCESHGLPGGRGTGRQWVFLSGRPGTVARRETEWFEITVTADVHSSKEGRGARGREANVLIESEKNGGIKQGLPRSIRPMQKMRIGHVY